MTRLLQRRLCDWGGFTVVAVVVGWLLVFQPAMAQDATSPCQKGFEAATKLYDEGKWTEALVAFKALGIDCKFHGTLGALALSYEGWCQFNLGKHKEAAQTFEKFIKAYSGTPLVPGAVLKLAECYRELKDWPKAIETYHKFQKDFAGNAALLPQSYLGEAWTLYKQWQADNTKEKPNDPKLLVPVRKLAENVAKTFASNPSVKLDALFLQGQVYNETGEFDKAREVYEQIKRLRHNPRAAEALFLAGEAMYDNGRAMQDANRPADAIKRFKDAIDYYQRVPSKASLLSGVQRDIDDYTARIPRELQNREALQRAIQGLRQLAREIGGQSDLRPVALFRTANAYQFIGYHDESVVVYRHFLRLYPDNLLAAQAHAGLIQMLSAAGRSKEAEEENKNKDKYKGADAALSESTEFLFGQSQFNNRKYAEALETFGKFLTTVKTPELRESAEFYIAACSYGLERFEEARDAFVKFNEAHPNGALIVDATFRLGRCHFEISQRSADKKVKEDNLNAAVKYYEKARGLNPKPELLADITFQLGYLHQYLSEYDKAHIEPAVAAFRDYVAKWGDQPLACEANFQIAELLLKLEKFDDAVAAFESVIRKCPDTLFAPSAAFEIGRTYALAKQNDKMIDALQVFAAKYPTHPQVGKALYAIAADLEGRNKIPEACDAYKKIITTCAAAAEPGEDMVNSAIAAQLKVSTLCFDQAHLAEAVASCEQFIKQFQKYPTAVRTVVSQIPSLYREAKKADEAKAALTKLAADNSAVDVIRIGAGTALLEMLLGMKDTQGAYAQALKLLADPHASKLPASSYVAIGNAFLVKGSFAEARDNLSKALKLSPDDARVVAPALIGISQAHLGLKQYDEAEATANRLIKEHPESQSIRGSYPAVFDAKFILGKIAEGKNQTVDAVNLYNEVFTKAKGEAADEAGLQLGKIFLSKGTRDDCKTAIPYFLRISLLGKGLVSEEGAYRVGEAQTCMYNTLPAGTDKEKTLKSQALTAALNSYKSYLSRYKESGKFAAEARRHLEELEKLKPAGP